MEENGSCRAAFCESAALQGKIFADFQRAELPQSKPDGFDSFLWEGAFGMARKFPTKAQSLRVGTLPLGGDASFEKNFLIPDAFKNAEATDFAAIR